MTTLAQTNLEEEAIDWVLRLEEDQADSAQFLDWLQRSPTHVRAWMEAYQFNDRLGGIDPHKRIDVEKLAGSRIANIIYGAFRRPASLAPEGPRQTGTRIDLRYGLAAGVVCAAIGGWFAIEQQAAPEFATGVGQQLEVKLADSSIVHLNTRSRIEVHYSERSRTVRLLAGEALFTVAQDAQRPFEVQDGRSAFVAVGTEFNLRKDRNKTILTVTEGAVKITGDPRIVSAGQQVSVVTGTVVEQPVTDVQRSLAWRKRELQFNDVPLADVAAEFNRYNALQLQVEGNIGSRTITGVFSADRPQSLIMYLERDPAVEVLKQRERVVIRSR